MNGFKQAGVLSERLCIETLSVDLTDTIFYWQTPSNPFRLERLTWMILKLIIQIQVDNRENYSLQKGGMN